MRTHAVGGFCPVCATSDPAIGSACNFPKLASASRRLEQGARRRQVLRLARSLDVCGMVVEAAHDTFRDDAPHVILYVDADQAIREHGRGNVILTGLMNARGAGQ